MKSCSEARFPFEEPETKEELQDRKLENFLSNSSGFSPSSSCGCSFEQLLVADCRKYLNLQSIKVEREKSFIAKTNNN